MKKFWNKTWPMWIGLVTYLAITVILTILYNILPIPVKEGLFSQEDYYSGLITNMYGTLIDFVLLTIGYGALQLINEKKNSIKEKKQAIDYARDWKEPEAAYKISAIIKSLQDLDEKKLDLRKCYLAGTNMKELTLIDTPLEGASLTKSHLDGSNFTNCSFRGVSFNNAYVRKSKFINCELKTAKFENADLSSTTFENCDFNGAVFKGTTMNFCNFYNCDFKRATFEDASLRRAVIRNCQNIEINNLVKAADYKYCNIDVELHEKIKAKDEEISSKFSSKLNAQ